MDILEIGPSLVPAWPEIDYTRNNYDWLKGMNSDFELMQSFCDSVNLSVYIPQGKKVDVLAFETKMLISSEAREFLESQLPGWLTFTQMRVNGVPYNLLRAKKLEAVSEPTRDSIATAFLPRNQCFHPAIQGICNCL